jgi:tight adherence protein B
MSAALVLAGLVLLAVAIASLRSGRHPAAAPAGPRSRGLPPAVPVRLPVAGQLVAVYARAWTRLTAVTGRSRRHRALEAAVPEVLDVLRATIAGGASPTQGLAAARDATAGGPLAAVLDTALNAQAAGAPAGEALVQAARGSGLVELRAAGEALGLAEVTGAPPGRVLAGVALAAADRVRARQALLAATAEARLSAQVLAALGPSFLLVLVVVAPRQVAFLVREPAGWVVLAVSVVLEAVGILWSARIVQVRR